MGIYASVLTKLSGCISGTPTLTFVSNAEVADAAAVNTKLSSVFGTIT